MFQDLGKNSSKALDHVSLTTLLVSFLNFQYLSQFFNFIACVSFKTFPLVSYHFLNTFLPPPRFLISVQNFLIH